MNNTKTNIEKMKALGLMPEEKNVELLAFKPLTRNSAKEALGETLALQRSKETSGPTTVLLRQGTPLV